MGGPRHPGVTTSRDDPPMRRTTPLPALVLGLLVAACSSGGPSPIVSGPSPSAPPSASPPVTAAPSPAASGSAGPASPTPVAPPAWSEIASGSGPRPAPREDHTWTVDPASGTAWLFGGRDRGTVLDDLWRFDLATDTWTAVSPSGPEPEARFGHGAAWVPGVGLVVWAGQQVGFFDDLWAFDPASGAWRELPGGGDRPQARYGSCAALGPDGRLWISHGFTADNGRFDDTKAYDFASGTWADETPDAGRPAIRCLHDCLFTADGRLVLYAGQTTGQPAIGDLWSRGVEGGWTAAPDSASAPPPRQLYAVASLDDTAWVFGGGGADRAKLGDLWALDLATLAWRPVALTGTGPNARSGAAAIADPARARILVFGGATADGSVGDTWQLDV